MRVAQALMRFVFALVRSVNPVKTGRTGQVGVARAALPSVLRLMLIPSKPMKQGYLLVANEHTESSLMMN